MSDHATTPGEPAGHHGTFDILHPPDADLLADCVHCGFCLPACPTYTLWGEEMDSPRGRLWLMRLGLEGAAEMDATFVRHFDACLGCMACMTACPSGVEYGKLLEATRAQIERNHPRSLGDRAFRALIFTVFPYRRRLRVAALFGWLYQRFRIGALLRRTGVLDRLPPRLRALEGLLPDVDPVSASRGLPERTGAVGSTRMRVGMLTGCVQSVFFADVNAATARVLAAEGCEVVAPRDQQCCGALLVHTGREPAAIQRAKDLIATMESAGVDTVVVNAAGCGSTMKEYGYLLRDDPDWADRAAAFSAKVRDITELLDDLEPRAPRHPVHARVAYHDACHLAHAQGVRAEPRRQLRAIPGLTVTDIPEPELCCGSAGVYNLVEPEAAEELGRRKAEHIRSVRPDVIATGNPGCLLQIRRHLDADIPLVHPVQLIERSIRGQPAAAGQSPTAPGEHPPIADPTPADPMPADPTPKE